MTEQAKFTYFLLGKAFEKETKTVEEDREKQTKAIKNRRKTYQSFRIFTISWEAVTINKILFSDKKLHFEIVNEPKRIEEQEQNVLQRI